MMLSDPQQLSVALTSIEDVAKNATAMMVLIDIEFFKALMWLLKNCAAQVPSQQSKVNE